jgi:hypothetical protein
VSRYLGLYIVLFVLALCVAIFGFVSTLMGWA